MSKGALVLVGGWLALLCFFIPWIGRGAGHASGLQLAKGSRVVTVTVGATEYVTPTLEVAAPVTQTVEVTPAAGAAATIAKPALKSAAPWLFVLLAAAVLYVVAGFLAGTRMVPAWIPAAVAIALAVASLVILILAVTGGVGSSVLKLLVKSFQIGMWGTIVAHVVALVGGLLDLLLKRARRSPSRPGA